MSKLFRLSSLVLSAVIVAAGCAPAATPTTAPSGPTEDIDAAVQKTVAAIRTQLVSDLTAQAPLASPTAQDTETPIPAVATFPPTPTTFVVIFPTTNAGEPGGGGGGNPSEPRKYQCSITTQSPVNGSSVASKADFDAVWTVKNVGTKIWETSVVDFYYVSGQKMHQGASESDLPSNVGIGRSIKLRVDMVAPKSAGTYSTYWALKGDEGVFCNLSLIIKVK